MADVSALKAIEGTATPEFNDTVLATYEVQYDSTPTNFFTALSRAQTATGTPVPVRRSLYSGNLYATSINGAAAGDRKLWQWRVTFTPPPEGELPQYQAGVDNPLLRPVIYNVDYMDREYVIQEAKNVEALSHGDGKGGNRAADTLGPIVNAAGKRPDEPQVDTERLEVLVIRKNYAALSDIVSRNRTYKRSTNSNSMLGYSARELRYLLTYSEGVQYENGIEYWPGTTTILAETTTDLILDNVGYEYWDAVASDWKRAVDKDGDPMSEPINLKLDGDQGGDNSTTITYRYLTPLSYASLIT